jgi:hypothetical protein
VARRVVQVVPNVKVRMETQHSISLLSVHDLLRESFTFPVDLSSTVILEIRFIYLGNKKIYFSIKIRCVVSLLLSTKRCLFHYVR